MSTRPIRVRTAVCLVAAVMAVGCSSTDGHPSADVATPAVAAEGKRTEPLVLVTPTSIGAAKLGMNFTEIESAAGIRLTPYDAGFGGDYDAPDGTHFSFQDYSSERYGYRFDLTVQQSYSRGPYALAIETTDGFRLGQTIADLQRIYGDRVWRSSMGGNNSGESYTVSDPAGDITFYTGNGFYDHRGQGAQVEGISIRTTR